MDDRWVQVSARLLPAERRKLKAYLDAEGLSYNAWLRQQIDKLPRYRVRFERVDDDPAAGELARSEKPVRRTAEIAATAASPTSPPDAPDSPFLDRALEWLATNAESFGQFENQWIAIGPTGVIAADASDKRVVSLAAARGVSEPLMH